MTNSRRNLTPVPSPAGHPVLAPVGDRRATENLEAGGGRSARTAVLDRPTASVPAVTARPPVVRHDAGSRFDVPPVLAASVTEAPPTPRRSRRLAQGALVAALGLVAAGLALALPGDPDGEQADGASTTRVEADGPTASASLLASDDRIEVDGELTDRGALTDAGGLVLRLPDPSGTVTIDGDELTNLIEPAVATGGDDASSGEPASTTTTTAWVEPTLPPPSEWVDTGNGVLVPDLLLRIRFCESTNNYQAASQYSTARGAYQFLKGSWDWYGHKATTGVDQAHLATPAQQDQAALATLQAEGTGPWSESRPCWADPDLDPRYATARPPASQATTTTVASSTTGSGSTSVPSTTTTAQDGSSSTDTSTSSTTAPSSTTTMPSTTTTVPTSEAATSTSGS